MHPPLRLRMETRTSIRQTPRPPHPHVLHRRAAGNRRWTPFQPCPPQLLSKVVDSALFRSWRTASLRMRSALYVEASTQRASWATERASLPEGKRVKKKERQGTFLVVRSTRPIRAGSSWKTLPVPLRSKKRTPCLERRGVAVEGDREGREKEGADLPTRPDRPSRRMRGRDGKDEYRRPLA